MTNSSHDLFLGEDICTTWAVSLQHLVDSHGQARPEPSHTKTEQNYLNIYLTMSTQWPRVRVE